MKRLFMAVLVLMLAAALTLSATAETWHKYTTKDDVKVYAEADKNSKVVKKLARGTKVNLYDVTQDAKWYAIYYEKKGKQKIGWVLGKYLSDEKPCEHSWGKWHVIEEASCTEEGLRERTCKLCGETQTGTIEKLEHTYGKWKITKEATCTKEGEQVRKCKECGYKQTKKIEKLPHEYGDWKVIREATCTREGERTHKCKECGFEETRKIEKLPHAFSGWEITVPATDHSSGVRTRTCEDCGYSEEESFDPEGTLRRQARGDDVREVQQLLADQGYLKTGGVDGIFGGGMEKAVMEFQRDQGLDPDGVVWPLTLKRLRHDFGPWETLGQLTRSSDGVRVRVCKDCGYEQRETIETGINFARKDRGEGIRSLQQILGDLGYNAGKADGIYGPKLDSAFSAFAQDNGLSFEEGQIWPADVDALMNAWIASRSAEQWMGKGDSDSPVVLALAVSLSDDEDGSGDMRVFNWTLTNLGSERCYFHGLLLAYGDNPDFRTGNLVMELEGAQLNANGGNELSGSFGVANDWGSGSLNFAAMATTDPNGETWLSNPIVFQVSGTAGASVTVEPIAQDVNVNALADGAYPVAFNRGDIAQGASGIFMNAVRVYTKDLYDGAAIDALAEGDTIVVSGEPIAVQSVLRSDVITINDGEDNGGVTLQPLEDGDVYAVLGYNDIATYTEQGTTTLVIDPSATYSDGADIEQLPEIIGYDGIVSAIMASENDSFNQYNTTARIENGRVVELRREYVP